LKEKGGDALVADANVLYMLIMKHLLGALCSAIAVV
jgi:hypothetical protein